MPLTFLDRRQSHHQAIGPIRHRVIPTDRSQASTSTRNDSQPDRLARSVWPLVQPDGKITGWTRASGPAGSSDLSKGEKTLAYFVFEDANFVVPVGGGQMSRAPPITLRPTQHHRTRIRPAEAVARYCLSLRHTPLSSSAAPSWPRPCSLAIDRQKTRR